MAERVQALRSTARPSAIMLPQLTRFGSPRPRKASADSIRMALAVITVASTSTGASALGSSLAKAIRAQPMPMQR